VNKKMDVKDIKDGDSLGKYLGEKESALVTLAKTVEELKAENSALKKTQEEDAKKADKAFGEINSFVKGKWRETEPETVRTENFGRMIVNLVKAKRGETPAMKALADMGVRINRETGPGEWKDDGWEMKSDLGTPLRGDSTTGSYLIPTLYASEVMRVAQDTSSMMGLVRTWPMSNRSIQFPSESATLHLHWPTNEATAKTESTYTFSYVTLTAYTCAGWLAITEELNEDSLVPLGTFFKGIFGEAWGQEFDTQAIVANAAPCTGAMYASGVNLVTMGAGGTSFTDLNPDHLVNMIAALTTKNLRNGARFFMHPTVLDYLCNVKNDIGDYIVRRPTEGRPGSLLGYPYTEVDAMPAVADTAVSTKFVLFGNPKYILHGDRVGFEFRVFDQTEGTMQYDRIYLRMRIRQGFVTAVPSAFAVLKTAAA